jgi:hypothetical protein
MPEGMHGHAAMDANLGRRPVHGATDGIGTQLFVGLLTREQKLAARSLGPPILAQSREQPLGQRDQARTIALAVPHVNEPGLAVDIARFECEDLGDAQTGTVGGHHDHAILERLDFAEQGIHLVAADHGRQLLRDTRPGNVLHLRGPTEGDGIEEPNTSDIHLDGGSARSALMVRE